MKVYAPGKLILSGEHAVVHGAPAIALAVNRYVTASVTREQSSSVSFDLADLAHHSHLSLSALKNIKNRIKRKYHRFMNGEYSIREVLHKPFELAQVAIGIVAESFNLSLPHGVKIQVQSDIPMGCGMGSSAATILSVMHAISNYLQVPISADALFRLALEAENMQHGFSSGLDLRVAIQGGCIYMNEGHIHTRALPAFPMYMVNSGVPSTSTGQCVETVAAYFKNSQLRNDFAAITNAIDAAMQTNQVEELKHLIRQNHELLIKIGVVPEKVQRFIKEIEAIGGAAKICGAGSVAGDQAGVMLVLLNARENELAKLTEQYGYSLTPIHPEPRGLHAI